jgi:hypothetical protein
MNDTLESMFVVFVNPAKDLVAHYCRHRRHYFRCQSESCGICRGGSGSSHRTFEAVRRTRV